MANYIGIEADDPEEDSERLTARAFRSLSSDWTVLHHVSWQSRRGGKQGDGEADFILLHPKRGLLVVEVKGGGIDISGGRWSTINRYGQHNSIKNPFEQAVSSKYALVKYLKDRGLASRVRVGHAVVFPHMTNLPDLGPAGTEEITFNRLSLNDIESKIDRCCDHWALSSTLTPIEFEKIVESLAPTISIRRQLSSRSVDAEENLLIFTAEQVKTFSDLRARRGGIVLGGAGTGKTVLAIARAQQLAADGFKTLLVCYNALLGKELSIRAAARPQLTACTFHSLCLTEIAKAKLQVPRKRLNSWWEVNAPELLMDACAANQNSFDAIVVDEAQDFSDLWLDALRCIVRSDADAPFFLFADLRQDIWERDWSSERSNNVIWELSRNMRNTMPIATRVSASVSELPQENNLSGPNPVWVDSRGEPTEGIVIDQVAHLLAEGFGPENLVVLCANRELATRLRDRSVGEYSFGEWGSSGISVETIGRFKGLESQCVLLVLSGITDKKELTQAYVGLSRARSMLIVVGDEVTRKAINWELDH